MVDKLVFWENPTFTIDAEKLLKYEIETWNMNIAYDR